MSSRFLNNTAGAVRQLPAPHPARRSVVTCVVVTAGLGLLYVVAIGLFWPEMNRELFWAGLFSIGLGGAIYENAIRFDAIHGPSGTSATEPIGQQ